jgi:hypothetical protein
MFDFQLSRLPENSSTSTFTGFACSSYVLRWTILGTCSNSVDEITITFNQVAPNVNAGVSLTVAQPNVALAADALIYGSSGTWSVNSGIGGIFSDIHSPISTFTGNPCTTYTLRWTIQGLCYTFYDDLLLLFSCNWSEFSYDLRITFISLIDFFDGSFRFRVRFNYYRGYH